MCRYTLFAAVTTSPSGGKWTGGRDRVLWIIAALAALAVLAPVAFWLFATDDRVPSYGPSMRPTLSGPGPLEIDYEAYERGAPQLGDVVVLQGPTEEGFVCGGPRPASAPCPHPVDEYGEFLVKRVVGLPGDEIAVASDGRVIRDGVAQAEPFVHPCPPTFGCALPDSITVPDGHYFVMGDNRGNSSDSRDFGPVPIAAFDGRVILPGGVPRP